VTFVNNVTCEVGHDTCNDRGYWRDQWPFEMAKEVGHWRWGSGQKYCIAFNFKSVICSMYCARQKELSGLEMKKCWKQNLY
jgi:hypothetical protein